MEILAVQNKPVSMLNGIVEDSYAVAQIGAWSYDISRNKEYIGQIIDLSEYIEEDLFSGRGGSFWTHKFVQLSDLGNNVSNKLCNIKI